MQPHTAERRDYQRHYRALTAKADEIGWPLRFRTDLTKHDRAFVTKHEADRPFIWVLRDSGTHLAYPGIIDGVRHRASGYARMVAESFGAAKCKFFIWDGQKLVEYATADAADARMAEIEEELGIR